MFNKSRRKFMSVFPLTLLGFESLRAKIYGFEDLQIIQQLKKSEF